MSCINEVETLRQQLEFYRRNYVTGLYGRHDFMNTLKQKYESHEPFYLAMYDVNGLHKVNREQGYSAGDALLKETANCLVHRDKGGLIFHIGGDEFMGIYNTVPTALNCQTITGAYVFSRLYDSYDAMIDAVDLGVIEKKKSLRRRREDDIRQ